MNARVVNIGNSSGVIIPREAVRRLRLKKGERLGIWIDAARNTLTLSRSPLEALDRDFIRRVHAFSVRHEADLRRLAE
jgi:antitoxin component of MazEF toxin-antitoxin module